MPVRNVIRYKHVDCEYIYCAGREESRGHHQDCPFQDDYESRAQDDEDYDSDDGTAGPVIVNGELVVLRVAQLPAPTCTKMTKNHKRRTKKREAKFAAQALELAAAVEPKEVAPRAPVASPTAASSATKPTPKPIPTQAVWSWEGNIPKKPTPQPTRDSIAASYRKNTSVTSSTTTTKLPITTTKTEITSATAGSTHTAPKPAAAVPSGSAANRAAHGGNHKPNTWSAVVKAPQTTSPAPKTLPGASATATPTPITTNKPPTGLEAWRQQQKKPQQAPQPQVKRACQSQTQTQGAGHRQGQPQGQDQAQAHGFQQQPKRQPAWARGPNNAPVTNHEAK